MRGRWLCVMLFGATIWTGQLGAWANSPPALPGVSGRVSVVPSCPGPQRPGQNCEAPLAGATLQLRTVAGKLVRHVTASEDGTFEIAAPPGRYVLRVMVDGLYPRCEPAPVRIVKGRRTQVKLECDSGMR